MPKFLTIPVADGDNLANAKIHNSATISGLINGTSHRCYLLSDPSEAFTPVGAVTPSLFLALLVDGDPETTFSVGDTVTITGTVANGSASAFSSITASIGGTAQTLSGTGLTRTFTASVAGALSVMGAVSISGTTYSASASGTVNAGLPSVPYAANLAWRIAAENVTGVANGAGIASLPIELAGVSLVQATPANQPTYVAASSYGGKPAIQFNNTHNMTCPVGTLMDPITAENYSAFVIYSDVGGLNEQGRIVTVSGGPNAFDFWATPDAVGAGMKSYEKTGIGAGWGTLGFSFQDPNSEMGNANGTGLYDCYVDGSAVWRQTSSVLTAPSGTTLYLGSLGATQYSRFTGKIHEILVWNRRLTQAEMLSVQKWACDKYGQPYPWAGEEVYTLFSGDSLTVGVTSSNGSSVPHASYPAVLMNTKGVPLGAWSLLAVGGASQANMTSYEPGMVEAIKAVVNRPIVVLGHEWANQSNATNITSKATWFAALDAIPDVYVASGTSLGSVRDGTPALLTARQTFDAAMDAAPTTVSHVYVPLHTDARIGNYTSYATNVAAYWGSSGDGLHLNAAGYAVLAELFGPAYDSLVAMAA